jgi:putative selenate reductase
MSDVMRIQAFSTQLRRILTEYERKQSIFDIHASLFHTPRADAPYALPDVFGRHLATPVGPSAGPHTQLSQNIVSAFLCGGRFIELKTVQVKDDLVIPRPCIDMTDEGYNVEWSQELTLEESAHEYTVAWALVHLLPRVLGWEPIDRPMPAGPGVILDMSVGYDLAGITHPRMTRFMDAMADASQQLEPIRQAIAREFPQFADIGIPNAIVNSVTLSTMHGCPPDELERIARYLLTERRLHTIVKLNPTLLGKERVLGILHGDLGFREIGIPDRAFEHDLQYARAVDLIAGLKDVAAATGVVFGVKLSNTLAIHNHAGRLPGNEVYMSGRALYPVTMSLYDRLLHEFDGDLRVSFSAGVDAVNVATVVGCGALPVTGCTDLLKPGGYARMTQWLTNLDAAMRERGACDLAAFASGKLERVSRAAAEALIDRRYKKHAFPHGLPKVASGLSLWDCVVAPCVEACAVEQDVPEYAWLIAQGDYDRALEVILARNPLPGITGHVCTALCQTRCTRNDYEETVAIRALKRVAEERGRASYAAHRTGSSGRRVAIVGSGPSGLAAAAFLALNGIHVTIFEARDRPGGMLRTIPPFRLPDDILQRDIDRILELGVELILNTRVTEPPERLLAKGFDAVYLAAGFQRDAPLRVPGVDGPGVVPALQLLDRSRRGEPIDLGTSAVVIGGGDTAVDAARTAQRITGRGVTILYRRTRHEMPAAEEELAGALEEGNVLQELVAPLEIVRAAGRVTAVRCIRTALGQPGADGRRSPVEVPGSDFVVPCDAVIVAVGQLPDLTFLEGSGVSMHRSGGVQVDPTTRCAGPAGVYAGGDMVVEPGSVISACADGRKAAEAICRRLGVAYAEPPRHPRSLSDDDLNEVRAWRARRVDMVRPRMLPIAGRRGFALVESTLTDAEARLEALRCVQCTTICDKCVEVCPNRANYAFTMRPVSWVLPVIAAGDDGPRVAGTDVFRVEQYRQILHVDDFCNECDNCQTFCVHHGRPYADKPRLFLDPDLFAAERQNAFFVDGRTIRRREAGQTWCLTVDAGGVTFDDGYIRVRADRRWRVAELAVTAPFEGVRSLRGAAEMAVLHDGITRALPFLLER